MLSIISAIYNQRAMNELYYESLVRNTKHPFELIIVDNGSDDGSVEYFASKENVILIQNDGNYNYPYCQNKGMAAAQYDLLCFLNNDIIVPRHWDKRVLEFVRQNEKALVFSVASTDYAESLVALRGILRRWKWIKYPIQYLFGNSRFALNMMLKLMYGNLDAYNEKRFAKWGLQSIEGISGSCVFIQRKALSIIGEWDERVQAGDFDIFNRVKKASLEGKEIDPVQVILGVFFHHYKRLTVKKTYPEYVNKEGMITIEEKWGEETAFLRKEVYEY